MSGDRRAYRCVNMSVRRASIVLAVVVVAAGCSSDHKSATPTTTTITTVPAQVPERLPNLLDRPTLARGKAYLYRIPIQGCGAPIVDVNGRNWEPETPWGYAPFPNDWHVTTEGPHFHTTQYLWGSVRLEADRLVISLPNGNVVNRYHPTSHRQLFCA